MGIVPRHQVCTFECVTEFVQSFVYGSPGFTDVHQEVFADRSYPVDAGLFGDLPEFVFICGERDPRGPGEVLPIGGEEVQEYQTLEVILFFSLVTSAGKFKACIFLWQLGQRATVFSMTSNPPFESQSM